MGKSPPALGAGLLTPPEARTEGLRLYFWRPAVGGVGGVRRPAPSACRKWTVTNRHLGLGPDDDADGRGTDRVNGPLLRRFAAGVPPRQLHRALPVEAGRPAVAGQL